MDATVLIAAIFAYLLGSVSSAIIVSKLFRLPDPRIEGSRNPGATNVLRLGGKVPAALTLLGDVVKGTLPVVATQLLTDSSPALAAAVLMSFLGHLYPLYFGFKGGKGVATALGAYLGLNLPLFAAIGGMWIVVAILSRYSSLSSLTAMLAAPVFSWYVFQDFWVTGAACVIFVFVAIRHRTNIQRLRAGNENKIRLRKS